MDNKLRNFLLIGLATVFIVGIVIYQIAVGNPDKILQEAYKSYVMGEESKTIAARKDAFNRALDLYLGLEKEYNPEYGDGKLYYNIANSYFQLGEYPYAIYYYYKTLKLSPEDPSAQANLTIALDKLNFKDSDESTIFKQIFFFHNYFSLPERIQIVFSLALASLIFWSFYIWKPIKRIRNFGIIFCLLTLVMLASVLYTRYVSPLDAIIVKSTALYRDAGFEYAKVDNKPSPSGLKVKVLGLQNEGRWLWVMTPEGILGYVPAESVRVI